VSGAGFFSSLPISRTVSSYFVVVAAAVLAVDLAPLLVCFFAPAFLLAVLLAEELELEVAGAGEVCANRDTPASAIAIVTPIIAFFIVFFLWKLFFLLLSIKTKAIMNRG
jgi:hypothetical protein